MLTLREKALLCSAVHAGEFPVFSFVYKNLSVEWAVVTQPYRTVGRNWYGPQEPCLIFPGSRSAADWFFNMQCWPDKSPTGPGYVHHGFLTLVRAIWPELKANSLSRRIKHVMGYSLGGPLAVLTAEILKDVSVTTFCSPKIGTKAWADRYPHDVVRHMVKPDIVPSLLWPYQHIGTGETLQVNQDPITAHRYGLEHFIRSDH